MAKKKAAKAKRSTARAKRSASKPTRASANRKKPSAKPRPMSAGAKRKATRASGSTWTITKFTAVCPDQEGPTTFNYIRTNDKPATVKAYWADSIGAAPDNAVPDAGDPGDVAHSGKPISWPDNDDIILLGTTVLLELWDGATRKTCATATVTSH